MSTDPFGESAVDRTEIDRDIAGCAASQCALVDHLRSFEPVEPSTPSRLPDWSVGHVLTHLARNAEGNLSMLDGRPQYPHGVEGRNADIESGSSRLWDALVDDVATTCEALDSAWRSFDDWEGMATMLMGERPRRMLPFLRQREVEIHRVDLGLGYGFDDMPGDYVRKELHLMGMLWKARKPMGMTPLPPEALVVPPAHRLAWLTGRAEIDGLDPAAIF